MKLKPNEFDLIKSIAPFENVLSDGSIGVGDDCAVFTLQSLFKEDGLINLNSTSKVLISTDTMIDSVHFDREISSPFDIGWKFGAVNLSDIAAMGGVPQSFFSSLILNDDLTTDYIKEIYRGLNSVLRMFDVKLAGGNIAKGAQFSLSGTILGTADKAVYRSGAKVGESIYVTGPLGLSALGLRIGKDHINNDYGTVKNKEELSKLLEHHKRPNARVLEGIAVSEFASAMIDISDGFLQDLNHICERSNVTARLKLSEIPNYRSEFIKTNETLSLALNGGDDYELIFTVDEVAKKSSKFCALVERHAFVKVGEVINKNDLLEDDYAYNENIYFELSKSNYDGEINILNNLKTSGYLHF